MTSNGARFEAQHPRGLAQDSLNTAATAIDFLRPLGEVGCGAGYAPNGDGLRCMYS